MIFSARHCVVCAYADVIAREWIVYINFTSVIYWWYGAGRVFAGP